MAITFVASTRSPTSFPASTNNTSTCVINKPTGTASGDLLVAYLASGASVTFTLPSGWTLVSAYLNTGSNMTAGVAYKVAGGSEPTSYTFSDDTASGAPLCGAILTYRGVDTVNPINTHGATNTASTDTVAAPTMTSTAVGTYVWFRTGKTANVASEGDFAITGGTARQKTSNRGGSTQYFVESADSNGDLSVGSNTGASFDSDQVLTGSIERTVVLTAAPTGTSAATLPAMTSSFAATMTTPSGTVDAQLPAITSDFAGLGAPPSGALDSALPAVSSSVTATSIGGAFASTLPSVTSSVDGSVNPIGGFTAQLPSITSLFVTETVPFGEHVIRVASEGRAFRVIDDGSEIGLIPIERSQVTDA